MSGISDISSILQNSLLLPNINTNNSDNQLKAFQEKLNSMPSVLDKNTLTKLRNGEYEITLKEYTDMSTYNATMTALYGNNSANTFQNTLNILTNSPENELANAKSFVKKMTDNGMSKQTAVKTYSALKKYSLMSSFKNYNFVKTKA